MATPLTQIKELWQRLKPAQRVTVGVAAAATLGLIVALVYFGAQPEYGVLFSDLKPADAQTIVEKLKAANVPYRLTNGSTSVSVPSDRVAELRLQMAASGVLSGGHVGFDIFDKNNFGATDFAQRVNYQRALEGELARTLEGMDEVETARVHITPARESIFTEKAERAKASVVMRIRQNRELSRERTEAVVNLVASAIEGLDPGDVSVMDTRGRVLSSPSRSNSAWERGTNAFNSHLEARQRLEADTAERVIALLEPITGAGHIRANVAAELDFSQIEQTEEKYDPKSAVIRTQQTLQEVRNSKQTDGGLVGARANDPAAPATPGASPTPLPPTGDHRTSATTNYEIDKTVKRTIDGGGRLQRLSVSVVVDHKTVDGKSAPRPAEELKKIQDLVAAAVGIDNARGDQIVVQTIPFGQPAADAQPLSILERYRDLIQLAIKYGALLLAALLLMFFFIRPARRALQAALEPPPQPLLLAAAPEGAVGITVAQAISAGDTPPALPPAEQEMTEGAPAANATAITITTPRTVAELEAEIARELESPVQEVKRAQAIKNQLVEHGLREPEALAMTIRGWLQEHPR
jgi:flagellar M-ring protein FliF